MAKSDNMQRINLDLGNEATPGATQASTQVDDPYNTEIAKAERMIEELRLKKEQQQRELERQREIQASKDEFSLFRDEVLEKLSDALPKIDEELTGTKQEISDLENAKKHFQAHLKAVESINPSRWSDDDVVTQSEKFQPHLSKAARDYDQFAAVLKEGRSGKSIQAIATKTLAPVSGFWGDFIRGFAFSLPLIIALTILFMVFSNNG